MLLSFLVVTVLLQTISAQVQVKSCASCDPNFSPFENMNAALRGYNIMNGDPFQDGPDPGFEKLIFESTQRVHGRYTVQRGITVSELSKCKVSLSTKTVTSMSQFRKFVEEKSSVGHDLQVGTDVEVSAKTGVGKSGEVSGSTTIPPAFQRAFGSSRGFSEAKEKFTNQQKMMSIVAGHCNEYIIELDTFLLPEFTSGFKAALKELQDATTNAYRRTSVFRKFIKNYGTHFLTSTTLGAEFAQVTEYSRNIRKSMKASTLQECSYLSGSKYFGIQTEANTDQCTNKEQNEIKSFGRSNVKVTTITKGSRPTDLANWITQDFTPVPISFQLEPIANLLTRSHLKEFPEMDSQKLLAWFAPLYYDYCRSMGGSACRGINTVSSGCGIDDKCPADSFCRKGPGKHECTEWSHWECEQCTGMRRRTRSCTGCDGAHEEKEFSTQCKKAVTFAQCPGMYKCTYKWFRGFNAIPNYHSIHWHYNNCKLFCMSKYDHDKSYKYVSHAGRDCWCSKNKFFLGDGNNTGNCIIEDN